MPASQAREVIERELGAPIEALFEWIELDEPLGSASISQVLGRKLVASRLVCKGGRTLANKLVVLCAQVHKAKLRDPRQRSKRPFFRPVWDLLFGGYPAEIAPGRWVDLVDVQMPT